MTQLPADPDLWPIDAVQEHRYRAGCILNDEATPIKGSNPARYTPADIAKADRATAPIVRQWWERSQTGEIP